MGTRSGWRKRARKTGLGDAVVSGVGSVGGHAVSLAMMDFGLSGVDGERGGREGRARHRDGE